MSAWSSKRLDECCEIVAGATPSTSVSSYWGGDICWATPKDLSDLKGTFIADTPRKLTVAGLQSCAANVLPAHSVLFSSRAPIGHVAINAVPMATNQGFKSFIPNPDLLVSEFLYWWLRFNRTYLESLGNGATFKEVSKTVVSRVEIALPSLAEQRRIAAILDQAETLRTQRRAALAQLDSLTQSLFFDMFGDPVTNERGWPQDKLGQQTTKMGSGSTPTGGDAAYKTEGISLIRSLNVHDGAFKYKNLAFIDEKQASKLSNVQVEENDILLNITGASVARVCRAPYSVLPARVNQHVMIIRPKPSLDCIFLERLFLSDPMKASLLQIGGSGATREAITKAQAADLVIPIPPLPFQQTFATRIQAIEALKATHRAALAQLDALFASLQQRAFAGLL